MSKQLKRHLLQITTTSVFYKYVDNAELLVQ